jgi:magnesium transporter
MQSRATTASGTYRTWADSLSNRLLQPDVRLMLLEDDTSGLREFCEALFPAVVAEVLLGMDPQEVWKVLDACGMERQAEIFEFIDPQQQLQLVDTVDRKRLSKLIEVMSPDDRVDLLERMDEDHVESLMPLIAQVERDEIRKLLSYPENSAGSIMTTEYASVPGNISVREALDRLRQQAPDSEIIYYVFVLDAERHLQGVSTLRELILAKPQTLISELIRRNPISVFVEDDREFVAKQIALFDLIAIPVVDEHNRLVGIVTHDDVLDVVQEEAAEDAYRQSAMEPLEQSYLSTPLGIIARKRGVWLLVLAAVALFTAKVQSGFSGIAGRYDWLAWFLPLVLASGGNTGSQSATLVIRSMAMAHMSQQEKLRMARREVLVGLMLGAVLGLFCCLAVRLLFRPSWLEASVVGGTVYTVVTIGTVLGSLLPLLFHRLGMDPALMSNPLIASLSDIIGVVVYFTVAIIALETLALV